VISHGEILRLQIELLQEELAAYRQRVILTRKGLKTLEQMAAAKLAALAICEREWMRRSA
jgi:hypothetical protein